MNKPPCLGCNRRSCECHSSCKLYLDWKMEADEAREARNKERSKDSAINYYYRDKMEQMKRYK